jgi:C-methyltransferase-like protein/putative zinc binding protein/methyltransferase family protein
MTHVPHTNGSPVCRACGAVLRQRIVDLGMTPLCESFLGSDQLNCMEPFYPLHVYVCERCFLVQLEAYVSPQEIFSDYAYFSSFSRSWLRHAREYAEMAVQRFGLSGGSHVVELASNDGYLLRHFVGMGIPCLGIEPAANVAAAAIAAGVPTEVRFFDNQAARDLAARGRQADLLIANNVIAQVPEVTGFVEGMKTLLRPRGVITIEFPHVLRLLQENQFDTIYHEHFSYFALGTLVPILNRQGLAVFDVEQLPTHGGSLRVYAHHAEDATWPATDRVQELLDMEEQAGLRRLQTYSAFAERVRETKRGLLDFLIRVRRSGGKVAGYGAPGKGNTLLNYCGIGTDFLDYTVDSNPHKQGKFTPGTHIPIHPPERISQTRPDYVLILPWNLKDEIMEQASYIRDWGGKFVVAIPELRVLS